MPHHPPITLRHRTCLALLGLMMMVPFVQPVHLQPIASFYSEMTTAILGLLAAGLLFSSRQIWSGFALPRVALVPAILIVAIAAQWLAGRIAFPEVALLDALFLLWAALLACLGAALTRALGVAPLAATLTFAIVIGGIISTCVAAVQFFHWPAPAWLVFADSIPATNLGQRNHAADYLWLAVASAIGLRLRGALPAGITAALLAALVFGAALTGSRGPIAYGMLLTALGAWWWRRERTPAARTALVLAAATTLGFLVASALLSIAGSAGLAAGGASWAVDRLAPATLKGDARLTLWHDAWRIFLESPWLGCGAGNYPWRSFEAASQTPPGQVALPAEHAHNLILQWLAEYGMIAALAAVGVLAWWLRDALKARLDGDHWWLLAMLAVIGGHSLLEYPLWYGYFLSPFALLLGAGDTRSKTVRSALGRPIFALASVLAGLAMANLWRDERRIEDSVYRPGATATAGLIAVAKASMLAPLARHGIALAMIPQAGLAKNQARICNAAARFRPRPDLLDKCALLEELLGNAMAADTLRAGARRAWPGENARIEQPQGRNFVRP